MVERCFHGRDARMQRTNVRSKTYLLYVKATDSSDSIVDVQAILVSYTRVVGNNVWNPTNRLYLPRVEI
eukprot:scaffold4097_cov166-Amphora_coffeaeformis.AAC.25